MKLRFLIMTFMTMVVCASVFCQTEEKMRSEGVVPGTIVRDGKEVAGYIRIMGYASLGTEDEWFSSPWEFQKDIRFMEKEAFEKAEEIRNKDYEDLSAKDIEGYKYKGDSLVYESVKYADMSAAGPGMIPKMKFMRKILSAKISLYAHFQTPPPIGEVSDLREMYIENAKPEVAYKVGSDGKVKLLSSLNVSKELHDCPAVVEKYERNGYKAVGDEESASKANRLLNKVVFRSEVRLLVIEDYNKICP